MEGLLKSCATTLGVGLGLGLAIATVGCATRRDAAGLPNTCRAEPTQFAIGQFYDEALRGRMLKAAHARHVYVITPKDEIELSVYGAYRLRIHLDAKGRVESVNCG